MTHGPGWQELTAGIFAGPLPFLAGEDYRRVVILVFIALLATPYWLGPVAVWFTNRYRVPQWRDLGKARIDTLPGNIRPFFELSDYAFDGAGFSLVSVLTQQDLAPGFRTWLALYVNRRERTRAVAHAHVATDPEVVVRVKPSVYFVTKFADGRIVETANSSHVSPFPAASFHDYRQFPEVTDPALLYELHRLRTAPSGGDRRDFPAEGAEVAYLTRAMADYYLRHVGTGYLAEVEPEQSFRPTVKGAILMTWRLLPPLSWVARWRRARNNRAFLAEQQLLAD